SAWPPWRRNAWSGCWAWRNRRWTWVLSIPGGKRAWSAGADQRHGAAARRSDTAQRHGDPLPCHAPGAAASSEKQLVIRADQDVPALAVLDPLFAQTEILARSEGIVDLDRLAQAEIVLLVGFRILSHHAGSV